MRLIRLKQSKAAHLVICGPQVPYYFFASRGYIAYSTMLALYDRGIIMLDNAIWCPDAAKNLRENGFVQIDFYGMSHNNSFPSVTSIFFRTAELLKYRKNVTNWVVGGNELPDGALDDA